MSSKTSNFKIGLFIIIGMIVTVIGIVLFGGGEFLRERYTVETYFDQSVQGLDVGAPLKFNGVQIGNVSEIHFVFNDYNTNKQYVLVRANIFPDSVARGGGRRIADEYEDVGVFLNELVEKGLRLELSSQGITGVAFLNMVYVEPEKFPPYDIEWKPKYPYIPSAPGAITVITQSIENLTASLESIDFKELSEDLRALISDIDSVSNNLNQILESDDVRSSITNLRKVMENLNSASEKLPRTINQLNKT
ncbi:MAG: MCE family protein, partial [Candidatus Dadabacteria bacterium]|nr:MCE family protein [Candidatus Dadabacteria bacterium]